MILLFWVTVEKRRYRGVHPLSRIQRLDAVAGATIVVGGIIAGVIVGTVAGVIIVVVAVVGKRTGIFLFFDTASNTPFSLVRPLSMTYPPFVLSPLFSYSIAGLVYQSTELSQRSDIFRRRLSLSFQRIYFLFSRFVLG